MFMRVTYEDFTVYNRKCPAITSKGMGRIGIYDSNPGIFFNDATNGLLQLQIPLSVRGMIREDAKRIYDDFYYKVNKHRNAELEIRGNAYAVYVVISSTPQNEVVVWGAKIPG